MREEVLRHVVLDEPSRRREEDPFTGDWTRIVPNRIVGLRSRFEVDLNRPREQALYRKPQDSWGLQVWDGDLPNDVVEASLMEYDAFYEALREGYGGLAKRYGKFVVYDLHTYNHRREGPDGAAADESRNPQVNLGTGTMRDRSKWAGIIERFKHDLGHFDFPGGRIDVRENVKFLGGNHASWAHATFPDSACVLAIEIKKFFMDEWTGEADMAHVRAIRNALESTVTGVFEELGNL